MNSPSTIATRSATDLQDKVRKDIQVTPIPGDMKATEYVDPNTRSKLQREMVVQTF